MPSGDVAEPRVAETPGGSGPPVERKTRKSPVRAPTRAGPEPRRLAAVGTRLTPVHVHAPPQAKRLFGRKRETEAADASAAATEKQEPPEGEQLPPRPDTPGGSSGRNRERLGHREVNLKTGEVSFKQLKSAEIMGSIQIGLRIATGFIMQRKHRDILHTDFDEVESLTYPKEGTNLTPPHNYNNFKFYSYAPWAFRVFRDAFGIDTREFLMSLTDQPLRELSNPGASGSIFFLSHDDKYIIKTVQKGEHTFLRKLLPGYYMNLVQNKRTLLPKFYGHYVLRTSSGRAIRFIIMNNILPSHLTYAERYDLKGSTHGRKASALELAKKNPTLKDLDFMARNEHGLKMSVDTWEKLQATISRDCRVLESFKIMDYSLLVGVHNPRRGLDRVVASTRSKRGATRGEPNVIELTGFQAHRAAANGVYVAREEMDTTGRLQYVLEDSDKETVLTYDAEEEHWVVDVSGIGIVAFAATASVSASPGMSATVCRKLLWQRMGGPARKRG